MCPPTLSLRIPAVLQAEPSVAAYAVPLLQARAVSVPSLTLSYAAIGAFRCHSFDWPDIDKATYKHLT